MKNEEFIALQSERLSLRQIVTEDIDKVFAGLSHPDVIRYYGVSFDTLESTTEQMNWYADLETEGTGIWWAICTAENGDFIGAAGFNDLDIRRRKAEIGFWLLADYWGNGYISEALPLIIDYAFVNRDLDRIEAFVDTENSNCKKVMAKHEFYLEKTIHNYEEKDGRSISLETYVRTKD